MVLQCMPGVLKHIFLESNLAYQHPCCYRHHAHHDVWRVQAHDWFLQDICPQGRL